MSLPDELISDLSEYSNSDVYTPEMFAWKLLLDDTNSAVLSANLQTFTDTYDEADDPTTFTFEVLITIFMELIFGILKLNHYAEHNNENFEFDFTNSNLEDILPMLKHKFNELCYVLSVETIDETNENIAYVNSVIISRYCKIILRHSKLDEYYFSVHSDEIDDEKDYHMILNGRFKKTNKLNEVYSTCSINNKTYKISFDKVPTVCHPIVV